MLIYSSDNSDQSEVEVVEVVAKTTKDKKETSWVYQHAEKRPFKGEPTFFCLVENSKTGKKCNSRFDAKDGVTSSIAKHLKTKHLLKPPKKIQQMTFDHLRIKCL